MVTYYHYETIAKMLNRTIGQQVPPREALVVSFNQELLRHRAAEIRENAALLEKTASTRASTTSWPPG